MLRRRSRVIALALTLVGLPTAQAADTMLTLACQGIAETKFGAKDQPSREPISFGLVLNLTAKTAEGFPVEDLPVKIDANQATIQFGGAENWGTEHVRKFWGTIDRVTGQTQATFQMGSSTDPATVNFSLKCTPAQRMF